MQTVHLYWYYFSTSVFSIPFFQTWWTAQRTPTSWLARWNLKIKMLAVDRKKTRKWVESYSSDFFTLFCSMWFPGLKLWWRKLYSFFYSLSFSLLCVRAFASKKGNPTNQEVDFFHLLTILLFLRRCLSMFIKQQLGLDKHVCLRGREDGRGLVADNKCKPYTLEPI